MKQKDKIEEIKLLVVNKMTTIRDDYAKLLALIPESFKNKEVLKDIVILQANAKDKMDLLEELYKQIQQLEKE